MAVQVLCCPPRYCTILGSHCSHQDGPCDQDERHRGDACQAVPPPRGWAWPLSGTSPSRYVPSPAYPPGFPMSLVLPGPSLLGPTRIFWVLGDLLVSPFSEVNFVLRLSSKPTPFLRPFPLPLTLCFLFCSIFCLTQEVLHWLLVHRLCIWRVTPHT